MRDAHASAGTTGPTVLERRYRRLLWAYPRDYRSRRGEELLGLLLDAAAPGQTRPAAADAADLIWAGLRKRLVPGHAEGVDAGIVLAGPIATALAAGISAFLWFLVEPVAPGAHIEGAFGPYQTLGPVAFACWLFAALGHALAPARLRRWLVLLAVAGTLLVGPAAALTPYQRPPLWAICALTGFGLIAVLADVVAAGSGGPARPDRLSVPAGAFATFAVAAAVLRAAGPQSLWWTTYYRPGAVGLVVAAACASTAAAAVLCRLRGRPGSQWLWATLILAVPGGLIGPLGGVRLPVPEVVAPQFGRLAQALLATCAVLAAMVVLVSRRGPAGGSGGGPARACATALGAAAGLSAFWWLLVDGWGGNGGSSGMPGSLAFAGWLAALALPPRLARPAAALALALTALLPLVGAVTELPGPPARTLLVLAVLGIMALVGSAAGRPARRWSLGAAAATLVAATLVGAYDNGWRLTGWDNVERTATLAGALALVPCIGGAVAGLRELRRPGSEHRRSALMMLGASACWTAATVLPALPSWGPVLLVLMALGAVTALIGPASIRPASTVESGEGRP